MTRSCALLEILYLPFSQAAPQRDEPERPELPDFQIG